MDGQPGAEYELARAGRLVIKLRKER
jgi:hypothetical protein